MCDGFDHDNIDMDFEMYKQRTEAKLDNVWESEWRMMVMKYFPKMRSCYKRYDINMCVEWLLAKPISKYPDAFQFLLRLFEKVNGRVF